VPSNRLAVTIVLEAANQDISEIILDCLQCRLRAFSRQNHSGLSQLRDVLGSAVLVYKDGNIRNIGQEIISKSDNIG
jgi:hypothetical protein